MLSFLSAQRSYPACKVIHEVNFADNLYVLLLSLQPGDGCECKSKLLTKNIMFLIVAHN